MSKLNSERIETQTHDGADYDIVGCFESDMPEDCYTHYEVFCAASGACLTEGGPFYEQPSPAAVAALLASRRTA